MQKGRYQFPQSGIFAFPVVVELDSECHSMGMPGGTSLKPH